MATEMLSCNGTHLPVRMNISTHVSLGARGEETTFCVKVGRRQYLRPLRTFPGGGNVEMGVSASPDWARVQDWPAACGRGTAGAASDT